MSTKIKFLVCMVVVTAVSSVGVELLPNDVNKLVPWAIGVCHGAMPTLYLAVLLVNDWEKAFTPTR